MHFTIEANKKGQPYLKKSDKPRNRQLEGRGLWAEIGRNTDTNIEKVIRANERMGFIVLIDEYSVYRVLVLTD